MAKKGLFLARVLSSKNIEKLKTYINENRILLSNSDGKDMSKISKQNKNILYFFYYLLENTDFKDDVITQNNNTYKNDRILSEVCLSELSINNDLSLIKPKEGKSKVTYDQILKSSHSKDIVTKDFKDNEFANEDELMQKVSSWANKMAHWCQDDIEAVLGSMHFSDRNEKKANKFLNKLYKAQIDYTNDKDEAYSFDVDYIIKNIDNMKDNLYDEDNMNVKKALNLIEKYYPNQIVNKEFLKKYLYCMKVEDTYMDFFNVKTQAVKELMLYQDRGIQQNIEANEEDKYDDQSLITFIVKDDRKTPQGQETCRVVTINKKEFDRYIKYNNNYFYSNAHVKMYADKYKKSEYDMRRELEGASTGIELTQTEIKALMAKCAVNSFHIPVKDLDDFIAEKHLTNINYDYPPIVESLAYYGSALYDITPSKNKEGVLEEVLEQQEETCENNRKEYERRYANPEKKFNEDNNISKKIEKKFAVR